MTCSLSAKTKALLVVAAALGLAACGDPRAGHYVGDDITNTDFEDLAGWGADVSGLTREHAHSGRYATFVGPDREFSLTYKLPLGLASVHTLRAVDLSAWVYLPTPQAGAALTVQVFRPPGTPGPLLYEEALHLSSSLVEAGKWSPISHVFVLPAGLPAEAELRIYLWRDTDAGPVYLDDLHAQARE